MSYILTKGNLLDSTADVLVNAVNTVGIMGKGLTKQFADTFPEIIQPYRDQVKKPDFKVGDIAWTFTNTGKVVANVSTKAHWKMPSKLEWIKSGIYNLRSICEELSGDEVLDYLPIETVAVPPLGAGLGNLNKHDVLELMVEEFKDSPISFWLYNFE